MNKLQVTIADITEMGGTNFPVDNLRGYLVRLSNGGLWAICIQRFDYTQSSDEFYYFPVYRDDNGIVWTRYSPVPFFDEMEKLLCTSTLLNALADILSRVNYGTEGSK